MRQSKLIKIILATLQVFVLGVIIVLAHSSTPTRAAGSIRVSGTVTNSSGTGVANVTVDATDVGGSTVLFGPVTTDSSGAYLLMVDAGTYDFHFVAPGGSGLNSAVVGNTTVLANQTINMQLTPATHTFSGILTDANNNPIAGATLSFSLGAGGVSSTTDANGHFSITIRAGLYTLNGSVQNYAGYPQTVNFTGPQFDLTSSDVTQNLQIPLYGSTLTVVALDGSGNPVSNVFVNPSPNQQSAPLYAGAADSLMQGVTPMPRTNTSGTSSGTFFDGATFAAGSLCANFGGSVGVICNTGQVVMNGNTTVTISEPSTHTFSGILTDASGSPLPNAVVGFALSAVSMVTSTTDAGGHFSLNIKPGVYGLSLTAQNLPGYPQSVNFNGPTIDLSSSDVTQNLQIPLRPVLLTVAVFASNHNLPGAAQEAIGLAKRYGYYDQAADETIMSGHVYTITLGTK